MPDDITENIGFMAWRDTVAYELGYDIFEDSWVNADSDEQLAIVLNLIRCLANEAGNVS